MSQSTTSASAEPAQEERKKATETKAVAVEPAKESNKDPESKAIDGPAAAQDDEKDQAEKMSQIAALYNALDGANQVRLFLHIADAVHAGVFWHHSRIPHCLERWGSCAYATDVKDPEASMLDGCTAVAYDGEDSHADWVYDDLRAGGLDGYGHRVSLHGETIAYREFRWHD